MTRLKIRQVFRLKSLFAILILLGLAIAGKAQGNAFFNRLSDLPGVTVTEIGNPQFAQGYFILSIPQPLDHRNANSPTFSQRIFLGVQSAEAPTVLVTDGYGVDYAAKPDYQHEMAKALEANLIVVEHRYFGKSQPAAPVDYKWLTMAQAAADVHAIKTLLDPLLLGKWLSAGASKGGQSAFAHRMFYPDDVAATVLYGTAVKKAASISTTPLLKPLMETPCGTKVAAFQKNCFAGRDSLFPAFLMEVSRQQLDFGDLEVNTVFDYVLLEFPFSFWQSGGDCTGMPAPSATATEQLEYLVKLVPLKYFTPPTRKRWAPAYYMFYHELGYYEYDLAPFQQYLTGTQYPNKVFAPPGVDVVFDRHYLEAARDFLESPAAHSVFFIYGENDPWALQSVVSANKYVVQQGSHKSRFVDLSADEREAFLARIQKCLGQ